ncbi:MAG: glycine cleavage system protein H [Planctomycetes bacterium]|jgi:glycine cleavage system H protein|nr:glycine cleavage system protein H [Planctomycetota bacterium]
MRPDDRRYATTHEWAKIDGDSVIIGITDFAIDELCNGNEGDLVYCDLPEVGRMVEIGETFGEIESVKAVSDLQAPITGEVVEVNPVIEDHLQVLAEDTWGKGWMVRIRSKAPNLDHMLDAAAYEEHVAAAH